MEIALMITDRIFGARANARLMAMDALNANIMIADRNLNITYMNPAVTELLQKAEADLKKELPRFSVATLIGSNIDVFHKNPAHQRGMLEKLKGRHNATIKVGELMFDLKVSPLVRGGKNIGFVVEWADASQRLQNLDYTGQIEAISRSQAMIEFATDGTIIAANANFLNCLGYTLEEVKGRNHSIFVDKTYAASPAYGEFWNNLRAGRFQAQEFKRVHKNGHVVTIQASYNPIMDADGKVTKVVKFATDVSRRVEIVNEIGGALKKLAAGDLASQLTEAFTPEFEPLRLDFNASVTQLNETMSAISGSITTINSGSQEISTGAYDLSKRTEQQAAALEETAAALDQITANVTSSSKRAEDARKVATEANASAARSGEVVSHAVNAMSRIEQSSSQISNIIGVIDEIAFQTNLLALNAGVEAARAGDAGKGFAVVAQEVRELAQRSAQAAKEIKALIQSSATEVASGVKLVSETGDALKAIGNFIVSINQHMEAIAVSSREQSVGLAEVNTAVNQMDQTTQQNAAMVEQTSAASGTLANESNSLRQMISQFNLGYTSSQTSALRQTASRMAQPTQTASYRAPARKAAGGGTVVAQEWSEF
jgi:PAS domain S-box-containing protein